jgi:hypothetical protein
MQKHRVACPYCEAHLLVTEDLLGQPGECPACHKEFLLPSIDAFLVFALPKESAEVPSTPHTATTSTPVNPSSQPVPETPPFSPPLSFTEPPPLTTKDAETRRQLKPVKIVSRPAVGVLSTLLKTVAGLQIITGCALLLAVVFLSLQSPISPVTVLMIVGTAICIGVSAIPMLAFSEVLHIWQSQEEMLRHIVNHLREKE